MKNKKDKTDLLKSKVKRELSFPLDDTEMAKLAKQMAGLDTEIIALEQELEKVKGDFKVKITAKEKDRRKASGLVIAGEERRMVECTEERDYAGNAVRYYYKNELKEERVMTVEERQDDLPLKGKVTKLAKRKNFPGNGNNAADFKKAAAGDKDEKEDLASVIRSETNGKTKRNALDGPVHEPVQN